MPSLRPLLFGALVTAVVAPAGPLSIHAAEAQSGHARSLQVTGTEVDVFPAYSAEATRYGARTTAATGGSLTVTATSSDPQGRVYVDGRLATGPTTVTGLSAGDEVSVIYRDGDGTDRRSVVYLPPGYPRLASETTGSAKAPSWLAVNLVQWTTSAPKFEAVIDRHGVPATIVPTAVTGMDLKPAPGGWVVARPTSTPNRTGTDIVTLDRRFREVNRFRTVDLTNTDGHDAIVRADGSRILMAYERRQGATLSDGSVPVDAVIQEVDPAGNIVYTWRSNEHVDPEAESVNLAKGDYAHINSIHQTADGDILASFRHFSSVFKIAWSDHDGFQRGDVVWRLGGRNSDFTFVDDPADPPGPCAQHTATELENGNILIFDNGSAMMFDSMCVDPGSGTVKQRLYSRAVEYAVDPAAGTARMVWSSSTDRFTFFAGSAYRLPDGTTLQGFASDRKAVATLSDISGDTTWRLWDTATDGSSNAVMYSTYRAQPVTEQPDAEPPTAEILSPAPGTTVRQGEEVRLDASCTDAGGSRLWDCAADGRRSGDLLDTSTPGDHTVTLTATDGAGHTTTSSVTYRVTAAASPSPTPTPTPSPSPAPAAVTDLEARTAAGWVGTDRYGAGQRVIRKVSTTGRARVRLRVGNDGEGASAIRVRARARGRAFVVRFRYAGRNVTRQVRLGTFRTPVLGRDGTARLTAVITTRPGTVAGARGRVTVTGLPVADGSGDRIRIGLRAR